MGVTRAEARAIALSMPEAVEQDHHGRPSFRVGGKIFATLWNEDRINVMLDEGGILSAVESAPDRCEQIWWGKRLAAVGVTLSRVEPDFLRDLLSDAWEHKAPQRLRMIMARELSDNGRELSAEPVERAPPTA